MKILHTADLHLASPMNKSDLSGDAVISRRNELTDTFIRMVDYAAQNGITAFIIAGDLFDTGRVPRKTVRYVRDVIASHGGIEFFYLCGNHDGADLIAELSDPPENLFTFGEGWTAYRRGNTVITGRKTVDAGMYGELKLASGDFNVVVLHGQESMVPGTGGDTVSIPMLAGRNIDYLALGHIHSFRVRDVDDRALMCYPGCPEGRGFDECGEKGFVVIDTEAGKKEMINFIPFAKRTLHEVKVSLGRSDLTLSEICDKIDRAVAGIPGSDMVKLVLEGEIGADSELDLRFIAKRLSDRFFFAKVKDRTALRIDLSDYEGDVSLKGEMIRVLSTMDRDEDLARDAALTAIAALRGEDVE